MCETAALLYLEGWALRDVGGGIAELLDLGRGDALDALELALRHAEDALGGGDARLLELLDVRGLHAEVDEALHRRVRRVEALLVVRLLNRRGRDLRE